MESPVKIWRNQKNIAKLIGKKGKIIAWTIIRVPPGTFTSQAPYPVAVVALSLGKTIMCQLIDWQESDLVVGRRVIAVVRKTMEPDKDGIIPYGIKVKPI